jgi:hypothetical protein
MSWHRISSLALVGLFFWFGSIPEASGQQTIRGRAIERDTKAAADEDPEGFEVVPPKVSRVAPKPVALHVLEVNQECRIGARRRHLILGIHEITSYSDDRMRWSFYLWNKADNPDSAAMHFGAITLADRKGEFYPVVATEFAPDSDGSPATGFHLRPGIKTRFWIDFQMPKQGTNAFKVHVPCPTFGGYGGDEFPAFIIQLTTPIPLPSAPEKIQKPTRKPVVPLESTKTDDEASDEAEPAPIHATSPEKLSESVEEKSKRENLLQMIAESGKRYDGNMKPRPTVNYKGGIIFDKHVEGQLIKARLFIDSKPPRDIRLTGGVVEDVRAKGGAVLVMEDRDQVTYRFTLDGKFLVGKDSNGGLFVLFANQ